MPGPVFRCGLDAAVSVVGGKWKPMIVWALSVHPSRFGELRRMLHHEVTEKVLTQQLKELERDGIVRRRVVSPMPPHVEYSLTDAGITLDGALAVLGDWGEDHKDRLSAIRLAATA